MADYEDYDNEGYNDDYGQGAQLDDLDDLAGATGEEGLDGLNDAEQEGIVEVGTGQSGLRKANEKRITTPYMTKYERARILGTRALQIR